MRRVFEGPKWDFWALLRVVPFILFLMTLFGTFAERHLDSRAVFWLVALGLASLGAWFVWAPKPHNGR